MAEIENTKNLTLAQLIEIWEICNSPMNCQKCPLNNTSCAKILHTATLEALKNLVQLVDFQKEEIDDFKRLTTIQRGREYYNKFVTEVFQKERNNDLVYPDFDEIYKRYFEQKAEIERLNTALASALKFNSDLEADKRLANIELSRLNTEIETLQIVHAEMHESLRLASEANKDMEKTINHYKINLPYLEYQNEDFCGVPCKFMEELIEKAKAEAIKECLDKFDIEYCKMFSIPEIEFMKAFKRRFLKEMVGESNGNQ